MIVRSVPLRSLDHRDMISWMRRALYSKALRDLVAVMMHDDPRQRPTAKSLYEACEAATFSKRARGLEKDKRGYLQLQEVQRRPW